VLKTGNRWLVPGLALLILLSVTQIGIAANEPPVTLFINPNPSPEYRVDVWVDRGQGAIYYPGDSIDVYYKATKDSYVYILNIDAANRSRWLLPSQWFPSNYVKADRTYVLPNMRVEAPSGTEQLFVFASTEPLSLPYLEDSLRSGKDLSFIEGEANFVLGAIQAKIKIAPQRNWVSSSTYFYVSTQYAIPIPKPIPIKPPLPQPPVTRYARMDVSTKPSRARVFLDGVDRGISPVSIKDLTLGAHEITVVLPGYYTYTRKFDVKHIQTHRLTATLKQIK
jgi:hypothetical protein